MKEDYLPAPRNEALVNATKEANGIFEAMATEVENQIKKGVLELDVLKIANKCGLDLDERSLEELQVDRIVIAKTWLPYYIWYPWRPIWCWWWRRYYPWYRCCYWWWNRCHYYPYVR